MNQTWKRPFFGVFSTPSKSFAQKYTFCFHFANQKKAEKIDYNDPEFRSVDNPRWVEAGMPPSMVEVLKEKGIVQLTPVQAEAFDPVLAGQDVIGRSRTGTGKTLAFGMPSLTRLAKWVEEKGYMDERGRVVRGRPVSMLVLCPTRELARQVKEELSMIARPLGLYATVFHGGVSYGPQVCRQNSF